MKQIEGCEIKKTTVFNFDKNIQPKKDCYSFKHSGDIGDLIYSLPVVRHYGGGRLLLNPFGLPSKKPDGSSSGFNNNIIKLLRPLLERQSYIKCVESWGLNFVDIDIDYFRTVFVECDNLCEKLLKTFNVPFAEAEKPWITCDAKKIAPIVVARSFRYRHEDVDYKNILKSFKNAVFVGLPEEHKDFQERFGEIKYYSVKNFLEMAEVIKGSELFVGNQSSPMSLAIAMNHQFLQEYYPKHHDCLFDRRNANYIYLNKNANNKRT